MRFLFCLDLSLHASAGKKIWNLDFGNQTRPRSGGHIENGNLIFRGPVNLVASNKELSPYF